MSAETGGSAFPMVDTEYNINAGAREVYSHGGMTLRDYFAAKAMNGLAPLAFKPTNGDVDGLSEIGLLMAKDLAVVVYQIADAMLAERAK